MNTDSEYSYLTAAAFEKEVLQCDKPVIVEFGAGWCGTCRIMMPIINDFSKAYRDQIKIVRLDINRNQHLAREYSIQANPTFLFIKEGEVVDHITGSAPRKEFETKLISLLSDEHSINPH
jgi:thioredoxin 1